MSDFIDLMKFFGAHDEMWEIAKELPAEFFYPTICCLIDEYSAAHGINNREAWKAINECSKSVYEEQGGADYAKGWLDEV